MVMSPGTRNPFGPVLNGGRRDRMFIGGTNVPVAEGARNFGRTRTGALVNSGGGRSITAAALDSERGGYGGERLFGRNGEINASSNRELIQKVGELVNIISAGVNSDSGNPLMQRQKTEEYAALQAERHQMLIEAAASGGDNQVFTIIGESLGEEVYETLGRDGFARNTMMVRNVGEKETPRVKVRAKDVVAHISTTSIHEHKTMVNQRYVYPGMYYIKGFVAIEEKELAMAGSELLDEKYQDLLEQFLVTEDRQIMSKWNETVGIYNPQLVFNTLTPLFFQQCKTALDQWGTPAARAVISLDIWNDIVAEPEFANWFSPVEKHELFLDGRLGKILDVELITDGLRYETLRVLPDGTLYFLGPQITVGTILQQKPLQTEAINRYNVGQAERGWFMFQIQGDVEFPRAIKKASRAA